MKKDMRQSKTEGCQKPFGPEAPWLPEQIFLVEPKPIVSLAVQLGLVQTTLVQAPRKALRHQ